MLLVVESVDCEHEVGDDLGLDVVLLSELVAE